jgi:purine-binding chemotaxis protein CheW
MHTRPALLISVNRRLCAIPLDCVAEIMRPLPIDSVAGVPDYVLGVSTVRGRPAPVVALARVLGDDETVSAGIFVSLRIGQRVVALAVDSVSGIKTIHQDLLQELPPLLHGAQAEVIEAMGHLDAQLLIILRAAQLIPEDAWTKIAAHEVAR